VPPEVVELVSDSRLIREIDQNLKFNHSFFNKKIGKPALVEAWERSEKFPKTRVRDRGMYFLCLITGETNLERAKEIGGYKHDDRRSYIIYEDHDRHFIDDLKGITSIPYTNLSDEGKTFYFEMTMVELELIHK
jgi:hypothetical protein